MSFPSSSDVAELPKEEDKLDQSSIAVLFCAASLQSHGDSEGIFRCSGQTTGKIWYNTALLAGHVDGTESAPLPHILQKNSDGKDELIVNPEYAKWAARDMQVVVAICATLETNVLLQVLQYKDAREKLKSSYMVQMQTQVLWLRRSETIYEMGSNNHGLLQHNQGYL